jgi:hypothetical protein
MGFVKMFIDKKNFNEREYLCLLFTLCHTCRWPMALKRA